MIQRAHKIKLKPTVKQEIALRKAVGCTRYTYNWALERWNKQYDEGGRPTAYSLSRDWTQMRPEWSYESPRGSQTRAIMNLGVAYKNFFFNKEAFGKPKFKKRSTRGSFYIQNTHAYIKDKRISLTKIGKVRMTESLRLEGKIMGYSVSTYAGDWFVSVQVEMPEPERVENSSRVGVDVGCESIAVASDGTVLKNPRLLKGYEKQLKRAQRRLSRKAKRSKNRDKAQIRLQKIHQKINNTKQDKIHKFTTALAKSHGTAVVEDLSVRQMQEDAPYKAFRRAFNDTAMQEVHRQLEYKMDVVKAPRFYPSSKTCSGCGNVKPEFPPSIRIYKCKACGLTLDRDLNASYNLKQMGWVTSPMPVEPHGRH